MTRPSPARVRRIIPRYIVLGIGAFVCLMPFAYMAANSLKTYAETVTRVSPNPFSPEFWPASPQWSNFAEVWLGDAFGHYFLDSFVISMMTLAGTLATSSLAAYAFAKLRFPGKEAIFSVFLATLMIPETVTLIPNFLVVSHLGWTDRLAGLTVPFIASAFYIFLLRQFFQQIPDSLVENARMDGAEQCAHSPVHSRSSFPGAPLHRGLSGHRLLLEFAAMAPRSGADAEVATRSRWVWLGSSPRRDRRSSSAWRVP